MHVHVLAHVSAHMPGMSVCAWVCICIDRRTAGVHGCLDVWAPVCLQAGRVCVCIPGLVCTQHACVRIRAHTHKHTHTHTHIHKCVYLHTHTHRYTYVHMYIYYMAGIHMFTYHVETVSMQQCPVGTVALTQTVGASLAATACRVLGRSCACGFQQSIWDENYGRGLSPDMMLCYKPM